MVVHHIGQMVSRHSVGFEQDLHVHQVPANLDVAAEQIFHYAGTVRWDLHTHYVGLTGGHTRLGLGFGQFQAQAVIASSASGSALRRTHLLQPLGRTKTAKCVPLFQQPVRVFAVNGATLALPIRAVRAADFRPFVPIESQPMKTMRRVSVFNAQDKLAPVFPGETVVKQRYVGGADVGIAGRRGRNACSNHGVRHKLLILRQLGISAVLAIGRTGTQHGAAALLLSIIIG